MKKLRITAAFLQRFHPCSSGLGRFKAAFPLGIVLSDDQEANITPLLAADERGLACEARWLFSNLLGCIPWGVLDTEWRNIPIEFDGEPGVLAALFADAVGCYLQRYPQAEYKGG